MLWTLMWERERYLFKWGVSGGGVLSVIPWEVPSPARGAEARDPAEFPSNVHEATHEFRSESEK